MYDLVGKIITYFVGAILLFTLPVMLISIKQDGNIQSYVDEATFDFLDKSRTTGKISASSYEELMNKLGNTGLVYKVSITHEKKAGSLIPNNADYKPLYFANYTDEILDTIYNQAKGEYPLVAGDFISIEVVNLNPTMGNKMLSYFLLKTPNNQILSTYSGYVASKE